MNTTIYTDLETKVLNQIREIKTYQDLIYIGDLSGDPKKTRGILSSLVKKGAIDVNKRDGGLISLMID